MGLLYYGQNFLIYPSAFPSGARDGACFLPHFASKSPLPSRLY